MATINDDCLTALKNLPQNTIDSLVTDPPAGIAFMDKEWDKDKGGRDHWIEWFAEVMQECNRVLKPGAHGFVWALPRTSHWTATALENAGFEIRDIVTHVFGSGFPKSHNISKAIDKKFGVDREVIGEKISPYTSTNRNKNITMGKHKVAVSDSGYEVHKITAPATDQAKQHDGWGTALKPASEHWILIRKPFKGTVADNVLKHGTGGINIDASRVGSENLSKQWDRKWNENQGELGKRYSQKSREGGKVVPNGRFPANFICSGEAREMLDEQSGVLKSGDLSPNNNVKQSTGWSGGSQADRVKSVFKSNKGGASRFFYCAKASKSERGADNNHPTVKAQKLMRYLITMVTPQGGTVLDPFMGSGSTGVAAKTLGFNFIGIEKEKEYFCIAKARIESILL